MASAPAAKARRRYGRRSLSAQRITGTKCVRAFALRRWQSSMPPDGETRSSMSTTSGGCSSASSNAASASPAVRTLIPCSRRKPTSERVTARPGATISPSTSLGNGNSLLCVVLSSGSIDQALVQALARMITERMTFGYRSRRRIAIADSASAPAHRPPTASAATSCQSADRRGVRIW